jgi:hypothetical protein
MTTLNFPLYLKNYLGISYPGDLPHNLHKALTDIDNIILYNADQENKLGDNSKSTVDELSRLVSTNPKVLLKALRMIANPPQLADLPGNSLLLKFHDLYSKTLKASKQNLLDSAGLEDYGNSLRISNIDKFKAFIQSLSEIKDLDNQSKRFIANLPDKFSDYSDLFDRIGVTQDNRSSQRQKLFEF